MRLRRIDEFRLQLNGKCPYCQHVSSFEQHGYYDPTGAPLVGLFVCAQCDGAVLASADGWNSETPISVKPGTRPTFPLPEYEDEKIVPSSIIRVMREVYAGVEVEAWMLVGMGVRLVVESMTSERCATLGISLELGLKARLRELQKKYPALEGPMQMADTIRLLGNEVAHGEEFICGRKHANAAVEMIEEMIGTLYVLPARRKRLLDELPEDSRKDAIK